MNRTGLLYDNRYLLHDTGPFHPESADRLLAIFKGVQAAGLLEYLTLIPAQLPEMKWLHTVHSAQYIRHFEEVCLSGNKTFCVADNQMSVDTYETAMLVVGGILEVVRMVMAGEIDNAFCAVRPPGHHAEPDEAQGFCYFNNVAIAARYLQLAWKIKRVGIVDFDVHHGNGTQDIFEKDPTVFYYSIHEHPQFAYPGTGREFEQGSGDGFGFTKNSPVMPGKGDEAYQSLIERDLLPAFEALKPQVILTSTGFDAHMDDDMSGINLTTDCFSWIMERIYSLARKHAGGRLVSVLEGGYNIETLPVLAGNHMKILLYGHAEAG